MQSKNVRAVSLGITLLAASIGTFLSLKIVSSGLDRRTVSYVRIEPPHAESESVQHIEALNAGEGTDQPESEQVREALPRADSIEEHQAPLLVSGHQRFPARLTIPKIGVNAAVVHVGTEADGAMSAPEGPDDVAWFHSGPLPGEVGSAVISGHYGWKDDIPAVFDNLHTLEEGDEFYVEDGYGIITTFVVRTTRVYDEDQDATDVFLSTDGKSHLNLITCGGIWNSDHKSYSERLIVFADEA